MTDVLIYLFDHYRAAEAASQRQGDQSGAFIVNLRRFATAPDLISESLFKSRCLAERRLFGGDSGDLKKNFGRNVSISDVRYAMKSPFTCDQDGLGPSSRRRCLPNFFA